MENKTKGRPRKKKVERIKEIDFMKIKNVQDFKLDFKYVNHFKNDMTNRFGEDVLIKIVPEEDNTFTGVAYTYFVNNDIEFEVEVLKRVKDIYKYYPKK